MKPSDLEEPEKLVAAVVSLSQSVSKLEREVPLLLKKVEELVTTQETALANLNGGSEEKPNSKPSHSFCGESKCPTCAPVVNKAYQMGQEGVMAIPGVKEAVDYHQMMAKMGYEGQSWYGAPGVVSAIESHQVMMTPLTAPLE